MMELLILMAKNKITMCLYLEMYNQQFIKRLQILQVVDQEDCKYSRWLIQVVYEEVVTLGSICFKRQWRVPLGVKPLC